jgi:hypothetical protein
MDCCSIVIFSIFGSTCILCICMYCCSETNYFYNFCNRQCFCTCPSSRVSNISTEVVIQQPIQEPILPKYEEEVIYNGSIFVDENEVAPPEYVP